MNDGIYIHTVGEKKDLTKRYLWSKTILTPEKLTYFFLGHWLLVCQFTDISNQMETTGELSNTERILLYNGPLYIFFLFNV